MQFENAFGFNVRRRAFVLEFGIGNGDLKFSLGSVALATLVGIILNLIIPEKKKA